MAHDKSPFTIDMPRLATSILSACAGLTVMGLGPALLTLPPVSAAAEVASSLAGPVVASVIGTATLGAAASATASVVAGYDATHVRRAAMAGAVLGGCSNVIGLLASHVPLM